jgi:hypothetical protein
MVTDIDIIEEHIIIRETIGYEKLSKLPVEDIPVIIKALKILHNYNKMKQIEKK